MNWGIALLAYGEQHISEFHTTAKRIRELDKSVPIWVGTDSPDSIDTKLNCITIPINEEFNYNLKRIPIAEALKNVDTVWYCDTDIHMRNGIDFSIMNDGLNSGIHTRYLKPESVLLETDIAPELLKEYLKALREIIQQPLNVIMEENIIIRKCINTKSFLDNWERIDRETRNVQNTHYGLNGGYEGLIIWVSAVLANVSIWNDTKLPFWNDIVHFGREWQKGNQTIL